MERFRKDKLSILHEDSFTVQSLKNDCNEIIEQYNGLQNPLSDQGLQLATQINAYIMKINQLKDSNYEKRR